MPSDVEYSPVGEGLGMPDFWLYVWLRRAAVVSAYVTGVGLTLIISLLSRPGTSECTCMGGICGHNAVIAFIIQLRLKTWKCFKAVRSRRDIGIRCLQ